VPCAGASKNCSKTSAGGFGILASSGAPAFGANVGYDLATGLGSVNVNNLLNAWSTQVATATTVTVSPGTIRAGDSVTITANVDSPSNSSQGPTGTVQFKNGSTNFGAAVTCTPSGATSSAGASCTAQLTMALSALPPGFFVERPPRNTPFVVVTGVAVMLATLSFFMGTKLSGRRRRVADLGAGVLVIAAAAPAGCGGEGVGRGGWGAGGRAHHAVAVR